MSIIKYRTERTAWQVEAKRHQLEKANSYLGNIKGMNKPE